MSFGTFIFRKMCTKSDTKRDAGLEIPEDVEYIRDIRYGRDKKENILDICWPKTVEEKKSSIYCWHSSLVINCDGFCDQPN